MCNSHNKMIVVHITTVRWSATAAIKHRQSNACLGVDKTLSLLRAPPVEEQCNKREWEAWRVLYSHEFILLLPIMLSSHWKVQDNSFLGLTWQRIDSKKRKNANIPTKTYGNTPSQVTWFDWQPVQEECTVFLSVFTPAMTSFPPLHTGHPDVIHTSVKCLSG